MTDEKIYTVKFTSAELDAVKRALEREYIWNRKQIASGERRSDRPEPTAVEIQRARVTRRRNKAVSSAAIKVKDGKWRA